MTGSFVEAQAAAWYQINDLFRNGETPNGSGSTLAFTEPLRPWLSNLIRRLGIRSILDAPCGDWNWMQHVNLHGAQYTGLDLPETARTNHARFGNRPNVHFREFNLLAEMHVPYAELIICRDFLIHLPNIYVMHVLNKFWSCGARWLLTTNFRNVDNEALYDVPDRPGYYHRPINLEADPFFLVGKRDFLHEVDDREQALFELRPPGFWNPVRGVGGRGA